MRTQRQMIVIDDPRLDYYIVAIKRERGPIDAGEITLGEIDGVRASDRVVIDATEFVAREEAAA